VVLKYQKEIGRVSIYLGKTEVKSVMYRAATRNLNQKYNLTRIRKFLVPDFS
jgi:hypothetical protein